MSRRAEQGDILKTASFGDTPSFEQVRRQIDQILAGTPEGEARGIEVSNSIDQRGFGGDYRGLPVSPASDLFPEPAVRVIFTPR